MTADLSALIARLEAAEVGRRELDAAIWCALNGYEFVQWGGAGCVYRERPDWGIGHQQSATIAPVTTSLDAALALAERLYPEGRLMVERTHEGGGWAMLQPGEHAKIRAMTDGKTPALALCLAVLRAAKHVE